MNKHAIILFCYNNIEHIIKSFESLYIDNCDFFIVENKSENSFLIEEYFSDKDIKKYIQFEENITNNALNIFFKDFDIFNIYEYITITDCDIYVENIKLFLKEAKEILNIIDGICAIDLSLENLPNVYGADTWIPKPLNITDKYIECYTGIHLITMKINIFNLIKNENILDGHLHGFIRNKNLKWVKTLKIKGYHLTWDYYNENNDYYKFKINTPNLWFGNKISKYKTIL
jgi:hypothetical protein